MDMTLVGMPKFMASITENKPNLNLLEPKPGYQISSRINALSKDEIFLLQLLGSPLRTSCLQTTYIACMGTHERERNRGNG